MSCALTSEKTISRYCPFEVIVPSTACVWVMMLYLLVGTIMFAEWEGWNYLDSLYFCVTSLCKVNPSFCLLVGSHARQVERLQLSRQSLLL